MPQSPAEVFASGKQLPAALIIGINAREFGGPPNAADVKKGRSRKHYGELAAQALPLYGISTAAGWQGVTGRAPIRFTEMPGAQWMTDITFRCPAMVVADWNSEAGSSQPISFSSAAGFRDIRKWARSTRAKWYTCSATLDEKGPTRPKYDAADYAISKAMQEYWTNFAKTGDPDGKELPAWPKYQADTRTVSGVHRQGAGGWRSTCGRSSARSSPRRTDEASGSAPERGTEVWNLLLGRRGRHVAHAAGSSRIGVESP